MTCACELGYDRPARLQGREGNREITNKGIVARRDEQIGLVEAKHLCPPIHEALPVCVYADDGREDVCCLEWPAWRREKLEGAENGVDGHTALLVEAAYLLIAPSMLDARYLLLDVAL